MFTLNTTLYLIHLQGYLWVIWGHAQSPGVSWQQVSWYLSSVRKTPLHCWRGCWVSVQLDHGYFQLLSKADAAHAFSSSWCEFQHCNASYKNSVKIILLWVNVVWVHSSLLQAGRTSWCCTRHGMPFSEILVWVWMYPIIVHLGSVHQTRLIKQNFLFMAELLPSYKPACAATHNCHFYETTRSITKFWSKKGYKTWNWCQFSA